MNLLFKLPMWSITMQPAQLAFQLPRDLFSWACHVAWMIYFQYTTLTSNKFVFWINWKQKIMTVHLLYLWIFILYLYIKKGKYQKEEGDCGRHLSREMETLRKKVTDGKTERKGNTLVVCCGNHTHKAGSASFVHSSGRAVSRVWAQLASASCPHIFLP